MHHRHATSPDDDCVGCKPRTDRIRVQREGDGISGADGRFARVTSSSTDAIDRLVIQLTNAAPSCCSNPMGVDNIGLRP